MFFLFQMLTLLKSSDPIRIDPCSCFIFVFVSFKFCCIRVFSVHLFYFIYLFIFFRTVNCKLCRGQNISNANNNNITRAKAICFCIFVYSIIQNYIRRTSTSKYMHGKNKKIDEKFKKHWANELQTYRIYFDWVAGCGKIRRCCHYAKQVHVHAFIRIESSEKFIKSSNYWTTLITHCGIVFFYCFDLFIQLFLWKKKK